MTCTRTFVDMAIRNDGTGRTITGIVVPFNRIATVSDGGRPYREGFERGAFANAINGGSIVKLLAQHETRSNPLGRATLLREDTEGLYGEFKVSATRAGDETLELIRDGALDSFSIGFTPGQHKTRDGVTWRTDVGLREVSIVNFPAYQDARVGSLRAGTDVDPVERMRQIIALT